MKCINMLLIEIFQIKQIHEIQIDLVFIYGILNFIGFDLI